MNSPLSCEELRPAEELELSLSLLRRNKEMRISLIHMNLGR
jgi:hypothetical protein